MFGNGNVIIPLDEIKRYYPDQWVAIAVRETDADGLPSAGEVIMHDTDERFVWSALKLGEGDDLVHVFYTGGPRTAAA